MITSTIGRDTYQEVIRYKGPRDALVAAGLASVDVFPPVGESRRFSHGGHGTAAYFAVTLRGELCIVTRWHYWQMSEAA